ncbi:putative ribonuclease H protein [Vitis vinifera]|uniref:Putative ribonuclease H protein n=1 Tax=Vitis vinifera TaxID=29760 RepID=A0A438DU34_VITVI|nr:putative ribonuclease H protein [Vitis vinifera]
MGRCSLDNNLPYQSDVFRVFGSSVFVHVPDKDRSKLEPLSAFSLIFSNPKGGSKWEKKEGTLAHKPHLVRWNLVCLEKRKGGLGVRNLSLMNNALSCKWNWRFANERDTLWRSVISLKYGVEEGGWCTRDVLGRNGVGLWKAIRKKWGLFDGRVAFHLGNGQRVKFWKDKWCGDEPLCESFPSLFSISMSKNAWVSDVWNPVGDGLTGLLSLQGRLTIGRLFCWSSCCKRSKIPLFYVGAGGLPLFPSERIWRARVPPKVAFFAWEASWGKVLTQEQLQRRGFSLANRCFLCLSEEETVDHLLLHCIKTRVLWNLLFSLFGISWTLSCSVKSTLLGWTGGFVGKRRKKAWQMAPLCIFWTVWKERNRIMGTYKEFTSHKNLESILRNVGEALVDSKWKNAIEEEMNALTKNENWDIVDLPKRKQPVGCKWFFSMKYKAYDSVERYKA